MTVGPHRQHACGRSHVDSADYHFGAVSGAHFNPAVTFTLCLAREISALLALGYILNQICGGLAGNILAHLMFDLPLVQLATTNRASLLLNFADFITTAGLLSVILIGRAYRPSSLPLLVGLYISANYWSTSSTSFVNPTMTLARMFTIILNTSTSLSMMSAIILYLT